MTGPKEHGSVLERMTHLKLLRYSLWKTPLNAASLRQNTSHRKWETFCGIEAQEVPSTFSDFRTRVKKICLHWVRHLSFSLISIPSPLSEEEEEEEHWAPHSSLVFFPFARILPSWVGKLWAILTLHWCGQHSLHPGSKQTTTFIGHDLDHKWIPLISHTSNCALAHEWVYGLPCYS